MAKHPAKKKSKSGTSHVSSEVPSEEDFRAESDMRSLIEAEKIKKDTGRMTAALKKGREQRDALASVMDKKKET